MFTNRLNLVNLFAILMLSIALFLIAIGAQFFNELFRDIYSFESGDTNLLDHEEFVPGLGFLLSGLLILLLSLGLILRWKWVRVVFQMVLLLAMLGWAGFMFLLGKELNLEREGFLLIGMSVIGLGTFLFGLLFLGNEQVKSHLGGEEASGPGIWDALDK